MMDLKDIKEFPGRPGCSPPGSPSILRHPGDMMGHAGPHLNTGPHLTGGPHLNPGPHLTGPQQQQSHQPNAGQHLTHHAAHHRLLAQSKESLMGEQLWLFWFKIFDKYMTIFGYFTVIHLVWEIVSNLFSQMLLITDLS